MKPDKQQALARVQNKYGESASIYAQFVDSKNWLKPEGDAVAICMALHFEDGLMIRVAKPVYDKNGFYRGQDVFFRSVFSQVQPIAGEGVL